MENFPSVPNLEDFEAFYKFKKIPVFEVKTLNLFPFNQSIENMRKRNFIRKAVIRSKVYWVNLLHQWVSYKNCFYVSRLSIENILNMKIFLS